LKSLPRLQIHGHGLAGAMLAEQASQQGFPVKVYTDAQASASRVAAGLFTPLTGRNLTPSWQLEEALPRLEPFYRQLEQDLGLSVFHFIPSCRIFRSEEQAQRWQERGPSPYVSGAMQVPAGVRAPFGAVEIRGGGWLNIPPLLDALERKRKARGEWLDAPEEADLEIDCSGQAASRHPLWSEAGWRNAHGDILDLQIPGLDPGWVYQFDRFLLPLGQDRYRCGATYFWHEHRPLPRAEGAQELLEDLQAVLEPPLQLLDHRAGIRPVALSRVPILGAHPDSERHYIFNGFGSKGVLYLPWLSERFLQHLKEPSHELPKECLASRRILRQRDREITRRGRR